MKRFLSIVLTLCILCPMLSGCFAKKEEGAIFRYDIYENPRTFDPQLAESDVELMIVENGFEGLLRKNKDGKLEAAAAEGWIISEDNLKYTFKIRKDAKWDDGETPVTAYDFQFALRRLLMPQTNAPSAQNFLCIKNAKDVLKGARMPDQLGVEAPDAHTLIIELEYENPFFLELLTSAAAMPCNEDFFNAQKGKYGVTAEHTAFNGPFTVTMWDPETYVVMRTNKGYSSARSSVAGGLTLYFCENSAESTERFLEGTTDFAPLSFDEKTTLGDRINTMAFEDTVWSLAFNPQSDYFKNANIRKGVAYALDISLLEEKLWENYKIAPAVVPSAVSIGESSYRELATDKVQSVFSPEKAKSHFEKGLHELGASTLRNMTMIMPEHSDFPIMAGILQEQWEKYLGVYINIEPLKNDELEARLSSGDYDLAMLPMQSSYNSPASILENIASNSFLWSSGDRRKYTALLKEASSALDETEMTEKFAAAEQMIYDNAILLPMFFETSYYGVGKDVEGIILSPFAYRAFVKYAHKPE